MSLVLLVFVAVFLLSLLGVFAYVFLYAPPAPRLPGIPQMAPWLITGIAALFLALTLLPPAKSKDAMRLYEFGQLPVQAGGRIKPIDSVARTSLFALSSRQTWRDEKQHERPAVEWLLDVVTNRLTKDPTLDDKVQQFRIDNDQLLKLLELERRPGNYRYTFNEVFEKREPFMALIASAREKDEGALDLAEKKAVELNRRIGLYLQLRQWEEPRLVPPGSGPHWLTLDDTYQSILAKEDGPAAKHVFTLLLTYGQATHGQGDAKKFNEALDAYLAFLEKERPHDLALAAFEAGFNHYEPFYKCMIFYVLALLLTGLGWLAAALRADDWREALRRTALWTLGLTLLVHSAALLARMYISGRPPVTNLYSSAIFIGWGVVLMGLMLERIWGLGLGNWLAGVGGFSTALIAHFLGGGTDTLDVMQAVLDTNFWLATHVVCITFGYAATYAAGLLGMAYLFLGVGTPALTRDLGKTLAQAMYGVTCFAMFLSFTGTVLGGIWADASWGRFWGWDPKENGALLIVLANAIVLHARWGGMVRERGLAALCVFGNIVTTWSWFGVNNLGVGLHSYGFMDGARIAILAADAVFLAFIGLALVPKELWLSHAAKPESPMPKRKARTA